MALPGDGVRKQVKQLLDELQNVGIVAQAGMIGPERPDRLLAIARAVERYGVVGGAPTLAALRHGDRRGIVDDRGTVTFQQMEERANALANALRARGVRERTGVGILCRNHRNLLDATFAAAKLGARALFLNTDFAAPQARDVCAREGVEVLIHDEEFAEVTAAVATPRGRYLAWVDGPAEHPVVDDLIAHGNPAEVPPPERQGSVIMLTSGTTGTPKGAPRTQPRSLAIPAAVLSRIPFRAQEATYVAPPLFHGWGLLNALLQVGLGSTLVVSRRFDPERVLTAVVEHRCTGLAVVPVMLNRILALGEERIADLDLSELRIIACAGAQLEGALATRAMDVFGDVVYNLYGTTEVAYATVATPADLRAAPGCVGKPPHGATVRLYDDQGRPVPKGGVGRIFVGNGQPFEGYTGGGGKEAIDGLLSTGDVGHLDEGGRLFVDGRDDEMIVSGAENVFPREVEELLAAHEQVVEAAAVGVDDEEFGKRLRAFVVLRPGATLDAEGVKAYVRENLARYKVPRDVVFVDVLPRNPSGKVLKRELA